MSEATATSTETNAPLPPGPDGLPILGNTLDVMRRPLGFFEDAAEYGDVVTYRLAGQRFTAVFHPDHVERVLVDDHDRFRRWAGEEWGNTFAGYAEEGLLLSEGDQWHRQRLLIQDAFTPDRIESYADTMVGETERSVERWADEGRVDLKDATSSLTLRILARSLFDLDIEGRGDPVRRAAEALNERASIRGVSAFLPAWVPTPSNRRLHRAMGDLEDVLDDLVAERREDAADRDDLLSLLLAAETEDGTTLSEREVRDQLITFLFAGHETTALSLTYALHALGHHPDQRRHLREELDEVTGGEPPSLSDLPQLEYTERVIKETLRLYPPAYALFREATEEAEIGGYRVPEGSKVSVPQILVHRDERFYDDPEAFRPERWADGFEEELPDYAYFPFGGGPRHCIGMRFAMMELKEVLPTLLARLEVEPLGDPDLEFETAITLQPATPVEARVTRR
ncbi:cytochrome P450 [Halobacteriales archaeon QS_8_69_26]|nr:MAG: cytochrome P450 [Halobacteriales archaeon QS_8_69_26]